MTITPESKLKSLNKRMIDLLKYSRILDNTNIENSIKKFLRKAIIADTLYDRYVIAISGLQGVGKTTLLKQLYNIPNEFIPENIGRGERLPIFVTECDQQHISGHVTKLKNDANGIYEVVQDCVEPSDFYKISKDPDYNELFLELKVPYQHFGNSEFSFVLLPGFEDENNYWEELIKHTLTCAETCIFVLNERKYSEKANENIINKLKLDFGNAKPIIALSFSDESEDGNATLKKRVAERFEIEKSEEDRIICISPEESIKQKWVEDLISSISKYSTTKREFRQSQVRNLEELIKVELFSIINDIRKVTLDLKIYSTSNTQEFEHLVNFFTEEKNAIRQKYDVKLMKALETYSLKPIKIITDEIIEENLGDKLKKIVLGKDLKALTTFTERIVEIWNESNDYSISDLQVNVVNEIYTKKLGVNKALPFKNRNTEPQLVIGNYGQLQNSSYYINDEILSNLEYIFSDTSINSVNKKFVGDLENTMKLIPVLAFEYYRLASILPLQLPENTNLEKLHMADKIEDIIEEEDKMSSQTRRILSGVAIVLGIDASDGTIDTIPTLVAALGIEAGSFAASVALSAAGILGVGIVAASITKQLYKMEFRDYYDAKNLIIELQSKCHSMYLEKFDEYMELIQEMFIQRMREKYRVSQDYARYENLSIAMNDLRQISIEIGESLSEYSVYVGRTI
ncbi:hypothetical protein [Acetoanaerobium sticklandii]|uniref:hypothetical protein n=1 Tax=Acetoanaerobium sticklandii TaxID=1511 RepID=UPI003A941E49